MNFFNLYIKPLYYHPDLIIKKSLKFSKVLKMIVLNSIKFNL